MNRNKRRKIIRRILIVILTLFLFTAAGAFIYYKQNKKQFVEQITSLYNDRYPGTLTYDDVVVKNWTRFPNLALRFKNFDLQDTSTLKHLHFKAKEVDLFVTFESILKKQIQIRSVRIEQGELSLDDYTPLSEDEIKGIVKEPDSIAEIKYSFLNYLKKNTELELEDIQLNFTNKAKNKEFNFHIDTFTSNTHIEAGQIRADSYMKINLQALGFNLDNGAFGNNAKLSGQFQSYFDLEKNEWHIEPFDLQIDEQVFKTKIDFLLKKQVEYSIVFENQETMFGPSMKLLSKNISDKLGQINIQNPIDTRISLDGRFVYKGNPLVKVNFSTKDNLLTLNDSIPIDKISMAGSFINRFYDDERAKTEDLKNYRFHFDEFNGSYKGLDFDIDQFLLSTSPKVQNQTHIALSAKGSPTEFNHLLPDQYLTFKGGDFGLSLKIDGELTTPEKLLERSVGTLRISNTNITNINSNVAWPIKLLNASFNNNIAVLQQLEIPLNSRDLITLKGEILNISGLLKKEPHKGLHSQLELLSENVVWKDFLALYRITKKDRSSKAKNPERVLQESLISLYEDYNPSIKVFIRKFHYKELEMRNFTTGISYDHRHFLRLDETSFDLDGGEILLNAALDLETPKKVNLQARLVGKGDVSSIETLFNKEVFAIEGGKFNLSADIKGDLMNIQDILKKSIINFQISDTDFVFKPIDLKMPIELIDFDLKRDYATLNKLMVDIGEKEQIEFSGNLQNLYSLLFQQGRGNVKSRIIARSENLTWDNFLLLFTEGNNPVGAPEAKDGSLKRLKRTLKDIYISFNPEVIVDIDAFQYGEDIDFTNFHTDVHYKDQNTLVFKDTRVNYGDRGEVSLQAELDISKEIETPVTANVQVSGVPGDLRHLFNESAFSMKGGNFNLNSSVKGDIMKIDRLIANSDSHLIVENSALQHLPSGVDIPCRVLEVRLKNKDALLKKFIVDLPSGRELLFSAEMKNASYLFLKDLSDTPPIQSDFQVQSNELIFDDFVDLFKLESKTSSRSRSRSVLKEAVKDFYRRYQPSLKLDIKDFTYDKLWLQNLVSGFYFEGENKFYLESTAFDFYDAPVELDAHFNISETGITPFAFGFGTEALDLEKLLETFEFFGMESLKETDKIGGNVTVYTELQGVIRDTSGLDTKSMNGKIEFQLNDLQLIGFDPLIQVANKVFKKERFQDIRFRPIVDTMYLSKNTLEIPLVEIQSTAIQLFIVGHLGFKGANTNIWTSIPLSNFKGRDLAYLPDKKGYIESGKIVYVEAKNAKDGSIKYVLHLNPKKYYQERDRISNYRQEIKDYRYQRRQYKRDSRKAERQSKRADSSPDGI